MGQGELSAGAGAGVGLSLKGMLYDNVLLNYSVRADSGDIAFTYQLNDTRIPMHNACDLRIGLRRRPVEDMTKYYVAGVTARGGKLPHRR